LLQQRLIDFEKFCLFIFKKLMHSIMFSRSTRCHIHH